MFIRISISNQFVVVVVVVMVVVLVMVVIYAVSRDASSPAA